MAAIKATKNEITEVFKQWNKEQLESPGEFSELDENSHVKQADEFIKRLNELKTA